MSGPRVNASELTTTEGIVGLNDYVVNIQKYFKFKVDRDQRLIYAVGVLVDVQFILASCSVFYDAVQMHITPEKAKYTDFRIVADGVTGHSTEVLDGRKLRFIDQVVLHPNCQKNATGNKWTSDLAIVHTSFPFDLQKGIVGITKFGHVEGGAWQLMENRTRDFTEIFKQHQSVVQLGSNSAVCRVMSWGRRDTVLDVSGIIHEFHASPRLLLYKVKLANENDCEVFCNVDDRFCQMKNTTNSSTVVCAYRGNVTFAYHGVDYSDYPCIGTEGSPLICHPPGNPGKADIYGIVANIPDTACLNRALPVIITHIEDVSKFVIDVVGKANTIQKTSFLILLSYVWSAVG